MKFKRKFINVKVYIQWERRNIEIQELVSKKFLQDIKRITFGLFGQ
jgi:hypothetical protein